MVAEVRHGMNHLETETPSSVTLQFARPRADIMIV
jgi:hypothetical protein